MDCKQRDHENRMIYYRSFFNNVWNTIHTQGTLINIQTAVLQAGLNRKQDSCSEPEAKT